MKTYRCIDILYDYSEKYNFVGTNNEQAYWAQERLGRIGIPLTALYSSHPYDLFRTLHEVGHCEIFDGRFNMATREYKATQWAIEHMRDYNVVVDNNLINAFQEYIYSFANGKNISKYELKMFT